MIKYEKYYLLYCSIDVLDCDCCEKLCGKGNGCVCGLSTVTVDNIYIQANNWGCKQKGDVAHDVDISQNKKNWLIVYYAKQFFAAMWSFFYRKPF
jgi:hypothetical protein